MSADQRRWIRDAVLFNVCGATRRDVLTTFAAEFLVLGLAAGLVAVVVGLALTLIRGLSGTARALARNPGPYLRNE